MKIKEFIEKWNVAYEDTQQQIEFAAEMKRNLKQLVEAHGDGSKALAKVNRLKKWSMSYFNSFDKALEYVSENLREKDKKIEGLQTRVEKLEREQSVHKPLTASLTYLSELP